MTKIDESLYSRQLYVLGKEAMEKMNKSSVLISGMNGLGVEIAKCVILGGVKEVTIHDSKIINYDIYDSTNYYISKNDIGKQLAKITVEKLKELNPYVKVSDNTSDTEIYDEKIIKKHDVVVICNRYNINDLVKINNLCRKYNVKFIMCNTFGLMGQLFCDFGNDFIIRDVDGEELKQGIITEIINKDNGSILILGEQHNLNMDDTINIYNDNVLSFNNLNIKIIDRTKIYVDVKLVEGIKSNYRYDQIKHHKHINFNSLKESIVNPTFVEFDVFNTQKSIDMHAIFTTLGKNKYANIPKCHDNNEQEKFIKLIEKNNKNKKLDFDFIKKISNTLEAQICPMQSVIGSIAAQEIMKACSGKFSPIYQWLYFESIGSFIHNDLNNKKISDNDHLLYNENMEESRYNCQTTLFGKKYQEILKTKKIFLVGAGAIGCEHLKNFAMMGIGNIIITDMDNIEKSNLNRQFLFRNNDIGNSKSVTAAREIKKINPLIKIIPHENKVCPETSNIYNEKFFGDIFCVANALDNVQARLYVDSLCVNYHVPLLESGTLGSKGNTQIIIPNLTESYGSTQDPPEKSVPVCTLKNFPYMIEHTIQYARDVFEGKFNQSPNNLIKYIKNSGDINNLSLSELSNIIPEIKETIDNIPNDYSDCISFGYKLWNELFKDQIMSLIEKYPPNHVTEQQIPFWSGTKKCPQPLQFNEKDELDIKFIEYTANLWAHVFDIKINKKINLITQIKKNYKLKINHTKENNIKNVVKYNEMSKEELLNILPKPELFLKLNINPIEFEKDDDANNHIDFITCCSNLRAKNYNIVMVDRHKTKGIAGKIIPAIATTTSLVSGLVSLELYKLFGNSNKMDKSNKIGDLENYRNYFVNIALPLFTFSEPGPSPITKIGKHKFTIWDSFNFNNPTLEEIIKHFKDKYNIIISGISIGQYMILSSFLNKTKYNSRLKMKALDAYKEVLGNEPISNPFILSIIADDEDDDIDLENITSSLDNSLPDCKIYY